MIGFWIIPATILMLGALTALLVYRVEQNIGWSFPVIAILVSSLVYFYPEAGLLAAFCVFGLLAGVAALHIDMAIGKPLAGVTLFIGLSVLAFRTAGNDGERASDFVLATSNGVAAFISYVTAGLYGWMRLK